MNIEKLNAIKLNYERQTAELASPEVVADAEKFNKICKELGSTQEIVEVYNKPAGYTVEFIDKSGYTIALLDLSPNDVRLALESEISK